MVLVSPTGRRGEEKEIEEVSDTATVEENPFKKCSKLKRTPSTKTGENENVGNPRNSKDKMKLVVDTEKANALDDEDMKDNLRTSTPKDDSYDTELFFDKLFGGEKKRKMEEVSFTKSSIEEIICELTGVVGHFEKIFENSGGCSEEVLTTLKNMADTVGSQIKHLKEEVSAKQKCDIAVQTIGEEIDLDVSVRSLRSEMSKDMKYEQVRELINKEIERKRN